MADRLHVRAYGETAVLVGVLGEDYEQRWRAAQALAAAVRADDPDWLVDLVATYDHVYVELDPDRVDHAGVRRRIEELHDDLGDLAADAPRRTFEIPVLFGGEEGPDLDGVAEELGLTPDELVERLTASPWQLRFVASPVGTPFTDRADWDAALPRVPVPRVAVPPGSLALSGAQSIIYPVRSPGGWRLVGRTPLRVVAEDPDDGPLVPYRAGDRLRYVAIDRAEYDRVAALGLRPGEPS